MFDLSSLYRRYRAICSFLRNPCTLDSRLLSGLRRPTGCFDTELLGVFGVQPLPAGELHGIGAGDAADGRSVEKAIQNIQSNVPPGGTHGDEAAIDVGRQRQARAGT